MGCSTDNPTELVAVKNPFPFSSFLFLGNKIPDACGQNLDADPD